MSKIYLFLVVSFFFVSLNGQNKSAVTKKNQNIKPNVVFLLVDDLGWKDLSIYGSNFYETPNIDRLAQMGTRFTSAYTPNPVCSPTRAAILTGKYPSRVGITDWIPGDDPKNEKLLGPDDLNHLPIEEITIAETLKDNGYKTFFSGKWHLGGNAYLPTDQGFDINLGGSHYGQPPGGYYSPYQNEKLEDGPEGEYLTDRLTSEAINFMERNKNEPFYVHLSFYTVHTPIQANKEYIEKFQKKKERLGESEPQMQKEGLGYTVQNQVNAAYASMVYALDKNVGRLLNKLDSLHLTENTLIIFTSDNGGLTTLEQDWGTAPTAVKPLRAGKGWAYEGGIRVPLIIKPPKENPQRQMLETPVISMDLYPTILDYLHIPKIPEQHKDGTSLYDLIEKGKEPDQKALFFHYPHYHGSGWTPGSAILEGDWKLIHFYENDSYELYNVKDDIGEDEELSHQYPDKVETLKQELKENIIKTNSRLPVKNE
ncbi:sulfatase [Gramella sp. AN32]|uniref:Sulfatase n=1 Tax=Christiangramia antarctica TaxID=2058158 RepID=A0ABW5X063_9FLAO|nr:sulfatase [Gramella sp. AN32]MCM4157041.1 arylsulfatase [Gramella sp. AN32]